MLILSTPSPQWQAEAEAFRAEFFASGETIINGSSLWDKTPNYTDWLAFIKKNSRPETADPNWVPTDVYFALDGQKIVGIIDLRHCLNDFLKDFGHSGYSVRPSERGKGYASQMLGLLLPKARTLGLDSLQLSCAKGNKASRCTILKNGGIFQRYFAYDGEEAEVYLIGLS